MNMNLKETFTKISERAPAGLREKILARIAEIEERHARNVYRFGIVGSVLGGIAIVPALLSLWAALASSGFISTLSLLATDSSTVFGTISEFLISLAESLPVAELAIVLGLVLVIVASVSVVIRQSQNRHVHVASFA